METIFHEKQEGSLCAQHCLNALLQGPYFTPVDLATLGQLMDDEERMRMAESGVDSDDYRRFLEQPSGNMDDSGYFSVQVINSALDVWGLELVPYNSTEPRAVLAQQNPTEMKAYICNYRDHWFTIRRLGHQWFNLNSLLSGPELISNTYLSMFLAQLQQEGYSIFVVFGNLPECTADEVLRTHPVIQNSRPRVVTDDADLQRALQLSLTAEGQPNTGEVDPELEQALRLSLGQTITPTSSGGDPELERALQLSLER
ncbi:ataxin-3-like isoform X2 [Lycorma delicatula]